ncbi:MAG: HAD hydrolase family protein, partial [Okeania sp. SIO2D1]|nr:HAD hydrolase family protein [Okeania sp. SIO2D1]
MNPQSYQVLASDYDGTLATDGKVTSSTVNALQRLRDLGWQLILVTGRELDHLLEDFEQAEIFALIVAENGA